MNKKILGCYNLSYIFKATIFNAAPYNVYYGTLGSFVTNGYQKLLKAFSINILINQ